MKKVTQFDNLQIGDEVMYNSNADLGMMSITQKFEGTITEPVIIKTGKNGEEYKSFLVRCDKMLSGNHIMKSGSTTRMLVDWFDNDEQSNTESDLYLIK